VRLLRLIATLAALATACVHGTPEQLTREREAAEVQAAAFTAFLHGAGRADVQPVVNCLGLTRSQDGEPSILRQEMVDAAPSVLNLLASVRQFVAPLSTCRHPPLKVEDAIVESAYEIAIESIERPSPDSAIVNVGIVPVHLSGPFGIAYGQGYRIELKRVDGQWQEKSRSDSWAT
jgi:hypothetical protein